MNPKTETLVMVGFAWSTQYLLRPGDAAQLVRLLGRGIPCSSDAQPRSLSESPEVTFKVITPGMLTQHQIDLLVGVKDSP
jgi:hypothetical protein